MFFIILNVSFLFPKGIRKNPTAPFVPRTVIIGGKVQAETKRTQTTHTKSNKQTEKRCDVCLTRSCSLSPSAGCSGVSHGQDDHQADHFSGQRGEQRPRGGRQAEGHLPGELQSVSGRERYRSSQLPLTLTLSLYFWYAEKTMCTL